MKTRVTELLGIEAPIIQGGMARVADASLAAAVSEAGGLGIIACGGAKLDWIADQVKQAMLAVVQSGTGTDTQIPGVKVAGKTGSAETGGTNVNSMFVGFAPYDSPTVAISVALEDFDKHDVEAAKIAGIVLTAALAAQGA